MSAIRAPKNIKEGKTPSFMENVADRKAILLKKSCVEPYFLG